MLVKKPFMLGKNYIFSSKQVKVYKNMITSDMNLPGFENNRIFLFAVLISRTW